MKSDKIKFRSKKKKNIVIDDKKSHQNEHHENIGFLLSEDTEAQQAKNQLRKASEDFYKINQLNKNQKNWQQVNLDLPYQWQENDQNKKDFDKNSVKNKNSLDMFRDDQIKDRKSVSYNQLRAKNQIKLLRQHQSVEKNIFQNKQVFFNYRVKMPSGNYKNSQKIQNFFTRNKNILRNKSIEDILKCTMQQPNSTKSFKYNATKYQTRALYVTPQIKLHTKTEQSGNQINFNQNCRKSQFLSTIYLKIPEFRNRRPNIKKNQTQDDHHIIQNNKFYLHKTNTICILQKQYEQVNKYISLSNYSNPIHYETLKKNKQVNSSQLKRNKNKSKTLSVFTQSNVQINSNLNKDKKSLFQTINSNNQTYGGDMITNSEVITTIESKFNKQGIEKNRSYLDVQQKEKKTKCLQAKTLVLRSEFQRLRKLLKKQTKPEFIIEKDAQMKIMKI